jgi:hypothetical protein
MKYMLLIYGDPAAGPQEGSPEAQAEFADWFKITEEMQQAGVLSDEGAALHPPEAATTVRLRDGERVLTDGPFAETKEVLGGYYIVDVPDLDTALDWAAKMPNAGYGSIEVRPVMEFPA